MRRLGMLLVLATMLGACSSEDSTGPDGNGGSQFAVTVSSGTRPTYSWPGGVAHSVSVMRVAAPTTIVWGIANPTQGIQSPATHGTVGNAFQSGNAEPTLTAGVRYRVSVTRQDSQTGWMEFTP